MAEMDNEDDPITATYQVFLNPSLPLGRRLLVLQHPNRTDNAPRPPPSEIRLKSSAGMLELDIPTDTTAAYDREKGLRWGRSLHTSMALKNGGSHGLAGGFGLGAVQQRAPPAGRKKGDALGHTSHGNGHDDDLDGMDWNEAVRQGKVLSTQTLGGQCPDAEEVQYMIGVFHGRDLHLTPVSSLVHLRPQLHHLDAAAQLERQQSSAAAGKDANPTASSARAIHMTIKTADADGVSTETMADRLRAVQSEPWRKMRYTDENDETAWEVYNESLFLRAGGDNKEKGKGKEEEEEEERGLEELVPVLGTRWEGGRFLEAVSGIRKPMDVEKETMAQDVKMKMEAGSASQTPADAGSRARVSSSRRGRAKA